MGRILGGHAIAGCAALDIGSGAGRVDITLVRDHGAGTVVGVDVQREFVDLAARRAAAGVGPESTADYYRRLIDRWRLGGPADTYPSRGRPRLA